MWPRCGQRAMFGGRENCRFAFDGAIAAVTPHTSGQARLERCLPVHLIFVPIHLLLKYTQSFEVIVITSLQTYTKRSHHRIRLNANESVQPRHRLPQVRTADAQNTQWPEKALRKLERPPFQLTLTAITCRLRLRRVRPAMAGSMR
jgi:hypothetical protein